MVRLLATEEEDGIRADRALRDGRPVSPSEVLRTAPRMDTWNSPPTVINRVASALPADHGAGTRTPPPRRLEAPVLCDVMPLLLVQVTVESGEING